MCEWGAARDPDPDPDTPAEPECVCVSRAKTEGEGLRESTTLPLTLKVWGHGVKALVSLCTDA